MPDVAIYALDENATLDESVIDALADDYANVVVQLYPYGAAWDFENSEPFGSLVRALAREPYRVERRGRDLIAERPDTTQELLPEWEKSLGLSSGDADVDTRRAIVIARLQAIGASNGSAPFFIAAALVFGASSATIRRDYNPFLCTSECTHALQGRAGFWINAWTLIIDGLTPPQPALEAFVLSYAQAHEIVHFEYT